MSNLHGSRWIRAERRQAIYARDGFACVYCLSQERLSLDHYRSRHHGGDNRSENLVTACIPCNSSRMHDTITIWLRRLRTAGYDVDAIRKRLRGRRRVLRALAALKHHGPQTKKARAV